mmetsp:Transcript_69389/g.62257  ORF Transcript_69389/g.62257 Transcript_69389/m.62257 type:complete len:116 (-) Transcript_69389:144-491(-)|eukprot:CAMPEP_0201583776 /NCGR_PEP_ID=MMETSP0190_2-20130828/102275_1 /ASSEMBLY_ACC=CAM_ASM_000263 /TAXON_ID=37353 /ORGANISM="Rosalina sp." /LENGTH=115 /DNA_ID=CAMNT_0048026311 /DNA_START=91 /DNA_END=438 /DNA_ORIENTATION=-
MTTEEKSPVAESPVATSPVSVVESSGIQAAESIFNVGRYQSLENAKQGFEITASTFKRSNKKETHEIKWLNPFAFTVPTYFKSVFIKELSSGNFIERNGENGKQYIWVQQIHAKK